MLEEFLNQLAATSWVEWLGMVTGMLGVWLSIKEKVAAWFFFLICYTSYTYIGYLFGLKAFMGMNVIFVGISIYGWWKWATANEVDTPLLKPTRTCPRHWPAVGLFIVVGTALVGLLLNQFAGVEFPAYLFSIGAHIFFGPWFTIVAGKRGCQRALSCALGTRENDSDHTICLTLICHSFQPFMARPINTVNKMTLGQDGPWRKMPR